MRRGRTAAALLAAGLLALGALSGCGDDDGGDTGSVPEIELPPVPSVSGATETTTAPETTTTEPSGSGGTAAPDSSQQDSSSNDTPPAAGSPQEAFEKECEQNPAACG